MPTLHTSPSRPPSAAHRSRRRSARIAVSSVTSPTITSARATFGADQPRRLGRRVDDRRRRTRRPRLRAPRAPRSRARCRSARRDRRTVASPHRRRESADRRVDRSSRARPDASARAGVYVFAPCPLSRKSRPRSSTWPTGSCGAPSPPSTTRAARVHGSCTRCGSGTATTLVGWIATGPTPTKRSHLQHSPYISCSYWTDSHDTCIAECRAVWHFDDETRTTVWDKFVHAPAARRLRPRDHPRVGQADVRELRRAAPRAVATARLPRHRAR